MHTDTHRLCLVLLSAPWRAHGASHWAHTELQTLQASSVVLHVFSSMTLFEDE